MTDINVFGKPPPVPSEDQQTVFEQAERFAKDAGELEMFAEMLGIPVPERQNKITEGE